MELVAQRNERMNVHIKYTLDKEYRKTCTYRHTGNLTEQLYAYYKIMCRNTVLRGTPMGKRNTPRNIQLTRENDNAHMQRLRQLFTAKQWMSMCLKSGNKCFISLELYYTISTAQFK